MTDTQQASMYPARPNFWTCGELLAAQFPDPVWIVPDLLPAGLAMLTGRPKMGKSFLALQLCIAVGSGGRFLGHDLTRGHALYVALEDSPRRIQARISDMGAPTGCDLAVAFDWPAINEAGLYDLGRAIKEGAGLVVVDTLARAVRGRTDWNDVGQVTGIMAELQKVALGHDACVLLIDHQRKGNGLDADLIDDVLGSTAKSAVSDTVMGMYRKRGQHMATLRIIGRDIDEQSLSLAFDGPSKCWQTEGATPTGVQADILAALADVGPMGTLGVAVHLDKDKGNISRELAELNHKGIIHKAGRFKQWELVGVPSNHNNNNMSQQGQG